MVVSEQVKDAVNQEPCHLMVEVPTPGMRLTRRGFDADHHVPEQSPAKPRMGALEEGEGEDVRGTPLAAVRGVQRRDGAILDQTNRQLSVIAAQHLEDASRAASQKPLVDGG